MMEQMHKKQGAFVRTNYNHIYIYMKGELFLFLRKGEDIPVFDGEFTIENHYEFLSSV